MGIDEAGIRHVVTELDEPGLGVGQRHHLVAGTECGDEAVLERDGLRHCWLGHRHDPANEDDAPGLFGGWRGNEYGRSRADRPADGSGWKRRRQPLGHAGGENHQRGDGERQPTVSPWTECPVSDHRWLLPGSRIGFQIPADRLQEAGLVVRNLITVRRGRRQDRRRPSSGMEQYAAILCELGLAPCARLARADEHVAVTPEVEPGAVA